MPELIEEGVRPYYDLGLYLCPDPWNAEMLAQADIEGVIPLKVDEGGPARRAGITPLQPTSGRTFAVPSVIVGINGTPTPDRHSFDRVLEEMRDHASLLFDLLPTDLDYSVRVGSDGRLLRVLEPPFTVGEVVQVELVR